VAVAPRTGRIRGKIAVKWYTNQSPGLKIQTYVDDCHSKFQISMHSQAFCRASIRTLDAPLPELPFGFLVLSSWMLSICQWV